MARLYVSLLLVFFLSLTSLTADTRPKPLSKSEVLALVAGSALPENIIHVLGERGLNFHPDESYRSQLKAAGADGKTLAALDSATVLAPESSAGTSDQDRLQHISNAAAWMKDKRYTGAAQELQAYYNASFGGAETGFVMGELLRLEQRPAEAVAVYEEVLRENADFPEAHAKLSFVLYQAGDYEESLREANAALAQNPQNPEGHNNAGLALESMRKFDAAEAEYRQALRLKPDYELALYDLGNLFREKGAVDDAIAEYKKALALNPDDMGAHENLGITLEQKGDIDSAINEFRTAKRLDPNEFGARVDLAGALKEHGMYAAAVEEFRELEKMFPNSEICHLCLGEALFEVWDFAGAEQELDRAAAMDPADALTHVWLGAIREEQKKYDAALDEYHRAEQLDNTSIDAHKNAGRVLLAEKDFPRAIEELKQAENLKPSNGDIHDLYGRALAASGDNQTAIDEFKQSLGLEPDKIPVMLDLAAALEKAGDWVGALDEYHKAAAGDASIDLRNKIVRADAPNPQNEYKAAQERFDEHIAALKAAGKSPEAAEMATRIRTSQSRPNLSKELNDAMQAGVKANSERRFGEALAHYKEAVILAGQLQPHDQRLATALDSLGNDYMGQDFAAADAAYERELKATEELYGSQSANMTAPLESLGHCCPN